MSRGAPTWLALSVAVLLTVQTNRAEAKDFDWQGTQVQFNLSANFLRFNDTVELAAMAVFFWLPKTDLTYTLVYFGPSLTLTPWLTVSPRIGLAGHWAAGEDSLIAGVWTTLNLFEGKLTALLLTEAWVSKNQRGYHGYYAPQWNAGKGVGLGVLLEHLEGDSSPPNATAATISHAEFGPYVHFGKGPWYIEFQYRVIADSANFGHGARVMNGLAF